MSHDHCSLSIPTHPSAACFARRQLLSLLSSFTLLLCFLFSAHLANATVADISTGIPGSSFSLLSTSPTHPPAPLPTPDPEGAFLLSEARHPPAPVGRIPLIVHYVYGLRPGKAVTFELDDFISVKSAFDVLGAERVLFWVRNVPSGQWWDEMLAMGKRRAQKLGLDRDNCIELKHVRDVETVFGRKVEASAHKADVIRMEALLTYGGIYMDMDVVALKSMDTLMERYSCHPRTGADRRRHSPSRPRQRLHAHTTRTRPILLPVVHGLPQVRLQRSGPRCPSICPSASHARAYPEYVHELGPEAFYWPSFDETGKQQMYFSDTFDLSGNYGVHLWSGGKVHRQGQKTFDDLCALNNTWGRIARTVLLAGEGNANLCHGRGIA